MILRNGVNSTLRAKGRSFLFFSLILLLTLSFALGLGMWAYCARALEVLDESYTSIALLEYMGEDYPAVDTADEAARQAAQSLGEDAIAALEGVILWETPDQTLAAMEGYHRDSGSVPYDNYGVVVAANLSSLSGEGTWVDVSEEDLACQAVQGEDNIVFLYGPDGELQAQVPYFEYTTRVGKTPSYGYYQRLQDGTWSFVPIAEEDLPQAYYVLDQTTSPNLPYKGRYYGPDLGWDTQGYLGYQVSHGVYSVYRETHSYTGSIRKVLYTQEGREGVLAVFEAGNTDFAPEPGKQYLLHGVFVEGSSANRTFSVVDFYEGCPTPPYQELTGDDDPALTEGIFADYAAYYQLANNYLRLEASDDIEALEAFHQNALFLTQGRFPQAGETGVCVVDGKTAMQLDLALGDQLQLDLLSSQSENRFDVAKAGEVRSLEVVGITNDSADYAGCIWVSRAEGGFSAPLFGYQMGRAVLDNRLAVQTAEALQALVPEGVRVTLYDQGYSAAAQPMEAMEATALAVTVSSICGALAVLFLFAYLFVGRQRDTVAILTCLGTPVGKIRLWLLSGAVVIAGIAALLGALAGRLLLGVILQAALSAAQGLYTVDRRYSEAAIGATREMPDMGALPGWPAAAAAAAVLATAILLCLAFLSLARRQATPKRGKTAVRVPRRGTSVQGRGSARFALLSALRGGWRSWVIITAALALTIMLGILVSGARGWSDQIDHLYDTTAITGEVTSTNGRQATNLMVSAPNARLLWKSGMLSDLSVSIGWNYWLAEEMPAFGSGGFAAETASSWIRQQPRLIALNSLSAAPAFYYGAAPEITWLDGWDESFLSSPEAPSILDSMTFFQGFIVSYVDGPEWETYPCLVSQDFLADKGLSLGDIFQVQMRFIFMETPYDLTINLQAVGSYSGMDSQRELYVPLSFWCDPSWLVGEKDLVEEGRGAGSAFSDKEGRDAYFYIYTTFSTCRFALRSAYDLDDFRDYLSAQQISQVGNLSRNRTTILLRDQSFVETVSGLSRYVTFSRILLPVLCAAVGLVGFVLSWLAVSGRRMEFAVMRGLGASRTRVFLSFFLEQAVLALLGCLAGGTVLTIFGSGWAGWLAAAGFWLCYGAGCALAVAAAGRIKLMALLTAGE